MLIPYTEGGRRKEFGLILTALFATAAVPSAFEKLERFLDSRCRLLQIMTNNMKYHYADTITLHAAVQELNEEDYRPIGFLRKIAELDSDHIGVSKAYDPNDRTAPMFLNAVRDYLEKFDALPPRLQYVVVNLMPTQDEILEFLFINNALALTDLTDSQYEDEINPPA